MVGWSTQILQQLTTTFYYTEYGGVVYPNLTTAFNNLLQDDAQQFSGRLYFLSLDSEHYVQNLIFVG